MKLKLILFIVVLIALCSLVFGAVPPGGLDYYPYDEGSGTTLGDDWGSYDGTISGSSWSSTVPTYNASGSPDYSLVSTADTDNVDLNEVIIDGDSNEDWTYCGWYKRSTSDDFRIAGNYFANGLEIIWRDTGYLHLGGKEVSTYEFTSSTVAYIAVANRDWHSICVGQENYKATFSVDGGTKETGASEIVNGGTAWASPGDWHIGTNGQDTANFIGYYTNSQLFSKSLNQTELENFYNYGSITCASIISDYFSVTAFDDYSNVSLSNFWVFVDSVNYTTINGTVLTGVLSNASLQNVIVGNDVGAGYFSTSYSSYNVSVNLPARLNQSLINFSVNLSFSGAPVSNFSLFLNGSVVINTSGFWGLAAPSAGTYLISVVDNTGVDDFATDNQLINVSALDDLNFEVLVHLHDINVTAVDAQTGAPINNFTVFVSGNSTDDNRSFNTSSGFVFIPVIHDSYNVSVFADSYSNFSNWVMVNINDSLSAGGVINVSVELFKRNSMRFNIFNLSTFGVFNGSVFIDIVGATITYELNTSNGSAYLDNMNNDTYEITVSSDDVSDVKLIGTINSGDHLTFDVYLTSNAIPKDFLSRDQLGTLVGGVTITMLQLINGSLVTVTQGITDFSGRVTFNLVETISYSFIAVKLGFNTFTGNVTPSQDEYSITMQESGTERFVSLFEDIKVKTSSEYFSSTGISTTTLIINSGIGGLSWYGINGSYNSTSFFINQTGSPAGGIESINITGINPSFLANGNVSFFFKYTGEAAIYWNETLFFSDIVANITIEDGIFNDLGALPRTNFIRGFIGILIVVALFVVFSSLARDPAPGLVAGLIGLGINYKFTLMPRPLIVVSLIVIVALLISDNVGGRSR